MAVRFDFLSFCLKPLQVKCFEYILKGKKNIFAGLPTVFGKSLLFQLLPNFLPVKADKNIVIFVCPLKSIIEDQLKVLQDRVIMADVLQLTTEEQEATDSLFHSKNIDESKAERTLKNHSEVLMNGDVQIVFVHPEALLSKAGHEWMNSKVLQWNVVACVVDEAHCVEICGEEFRKEFKDQSAGRAFFPNAPMMTLTATAPLQLLTNTVGH